MTEQDDQGRAPADADEWLAGTRGEGDEDTGVPVGRADVAADAAASGAEDVPPETGERDTEGVPVGRADADEDARRSGADLDEG